MRVLRGSRGRGPAPCQLSSVKPPPLGVPTPSLPSLIKAGTGRWDSCHDSHRAPPQALGHVATLEKCLLVVPTCSGHCDVLSHHLGPRRPPCSGPGSFNAGARLTSPSIPSTHQLLIHSFIELQPGARHGDGTEATAENNIRGFQSPETQEQHTKKPGKYL